MTVSGVSQGQGIGDIPLPAICRAAPQGSMHGSLCRLTVDCPPSTVLSVHGWCVCVSICLCVFMIDAGPPGQ